MSEACLERGNNLHSEREVRRAAKEPPETSETDRLNATCPLWTRRGHTWTRAQRLAQLTIAAKGVEQKRTSVRDPITEPRR